ncbi:hypothetical protein [Sphingomonas adhaesiva]|uniref:hypothetical protein n=1 Tax=Sphingomonas adhaesiva TaxID=28212 RepID=UPI002FFAE2A6
MNNYREDVVLYRGLLSVGAKLGLLAIAGMASGGAAIAQVVEPVAPVPRFGPGSHVGEATAVYPQRYRVPRRQFGRPGPRGTMMPSGQVGPACMTPLWKAGLRTNHVECPLYLPTRPGASQQCMARDGAGRMHGVTVTFLDWDASTGRGTIDCRLNGR